MVIHVTDHFLVHLKDQITKTRAIHILLLIQKQSFVIITRNNPKKIFTSKTYVTNK
jgi:hypothetical protein